MFCQALLARSINHCFIITDRMADTIHTRLERLLIEKRRKQNQLARHCGVSPQAVNAWLGRGRAVVPDQENLKKIAAFFDTTVDYLLGGDPGIPSHRNSIITVDAPRGSDVPLLPLDQLMTIRADIHSVKSMSRGRTVHTKHHVSDDAVAFALQDNSMEPRFSEQDIIVIDPQLDYDAGDYIAAHIKSLGVSVFRQFAYDGSDHVVLTAMNPQHRTFRFTHAQWAEDVTVLGSWVERTTINPKSQKRHTR